MMRQLYILLTWLLTSLASKKCQKLALSNLTVQKINERYENESLTALDMLTCTRNWLKNDREFKNIIVNETLDTKAEKVDLDLKSFGARSFTLQSIPVLVDYNTWNTSPFKVSSKEKYPMQTMLKYMGVIDIVLNVKVSFKRIMSAVLKRKIMLGFILEGMNTFNSNCKGLICLKFSRRRVNMRKRNSNLGPTLGLVTSDIDDTRTGFDSIMNRVEQQLSSIPRHLKMKGKDVYGNIYTMRFAMLGINSTHLDLPMFDPIISAINHNSTNFQTIKLNSEAVTDGVFSSKEAIKIAKLQYTGTNNYNLNKHSNPDDVQKGDNLEKPHHGISSGVSNNMKEKHHTPSITRKNYNNEPKMHLIAQQILRELINFKDFHFVITPSNHKEFLVIVEKAGFPSITIPSYLNSMNESMSIVSLYYDEPSLIGLASMILSSPVYDVVH